MKLDRLSWRQVLALGFHAVLMVPLVIAVAALSGLDHRWPDILAQFMAPALVITMPAAIGLALLRFRTAAIHASAAMVLLAIAVQPQWFPPAPRPLAGAPVVRLYSANLYYLNTDTARMRRSIEAADPDIVVLIEVGQKTAERLDAVLVGYPYRVVSTQGDETRGPAGSVVASRWPLTAHAATDDGLYKVIALVRSPLGPLNVVGVHLTRPWPFQYQWGQINQVRALDAVVAGLHGPVVVAGDFNSVSNARIGRQMKRDLGLKPAGGFPGTWPSAVPALFGVTIDQVWRSPDLTFVSRRVGLATGSDHRPVVTEITRAAP